VPGERVPVVADGKTEKSMTQQLRGQAATYRVPTRDEIREFVHSLQVMADNCRLEYVSQGVAVIPVEDVVPGEAGESIRLQLVTGWHITLPLWDLWDTLRDRDNGNPVRPSWARESLLIHLRKKGGDDV
jgi:hypothetical protein